MPKRSQALVLQHDRDADAGLLGEWLTGRGFQINEIRVPEAARVPDPDGFGLVVALGSSHCAGDDLPWIERELALVRKAHLAGIPVIGICFGGQLLARALGGRVMRDRVAEIGWAEVRSLRPDVITPGPWFEWHFDLLEPPADAEIMAVSQCGIEAFRLDRSLGLQFHPEVDRAIVESWAEADPADLERAGTTSDLLFDGIGQEPLEARAWRLFDAIGQLIGAVGS